MGYTSPMPTAELSDAEYADLLARRAASVPDDRDFASLVSVMARLRGEGGCPWDREQTHATLKPYLLEEAYEVLDAIDTGKPGPLCEELGDLLLQVVFHAQLASEAGQFTIADVSRGIVDKLIRRHPHVFGTVQVTGTDDVLANWEAIKRAEPGYEDRHSILDGIPSQLPALLRAREVSKRVVKVGFEWPDIAGVLDKVDEELDELKAEIGNGTNVKRERAADELGDLLFTVSQCGPPPPGLIPKTPCAA